jgi:hypothetical protein
LSQRCSLGRHSQKGDSYTLKFIDGKKVVAKYGAPIPKRDYDRFVGPYENKTTLDAIRKKKA